MPYSILGLHGFKGSGKSTTQTAVRRMLGEKEKALGYDLRTNIHALSFAEPLKDVCAAMFGSSPNWRGSQAEKESDLHPHAQNLFDGVKTYRQAMQFIGTDLFRKHLGQDVWVKLMRIQIGKIIGDSRFKDAKNLFIIDDVRFPNEAEYILGLGGAVVRIVKTGQEINDMHASEMLLADVFLTKTLEFKTKEDIEMAAGYIYSLAEGNAR